MHIFFSLLAIFLRAQAWEPCPHTPALTARGSSSICHHAWEREEVLCGTTREGSHASLLFQLLSMLPAEGSPENSLSALFRAEKVRLSVALAGLRDLDHWSAAQDLHREEQRGMGNIRPFTDGESGTRSWKKPSNHPTPLTDEKWSPGRVTQLSAGGSRPPRARRSQ